MAHDLPPICDRNGWVECDTAEQIDVVRSAMDKPARKARLPLILLGIVVCVFVACLGFGLYSTILLRKTSYYGHPTSGLRTILTGIVTYRETYKTYPRALSALGGSGAACTTASATTACLIDDVLASGKKSGIIYHYILKDGAEGFTLTADPASQKNPPQDHYFADQTGVIRVEVGRVATANSLPLGYE
jgi:hypothetical protein